jgi:uncharacterized protein involved in exopolysaccharide biosynthesis
MSAETLRKLESLRIEFKADYVRQETLLEHLRRVAKDSGPDVLADVLPTTTPDTLLIALREQLALAEQRRAVLSKDYGPQHTEVVKLQGLADDLRSKVRSRVDGIMLGLQTKSLSLSNSLENLEKEVALATANDIERVKRTQPYFDAKRDLEELRRFSQVLNIKLASDKVEFNLPRAAIVDIIDLAVPALRPGSANLRLGFAMVALGVLLDLTGFLLLRRQPGAAPVPAPA